MLTVPELPLLLTLTLVAPTDEPEAHAITLPAGRAAEVWGAVGPTTEPALIPAELAPLLAGDTWSRPATWSAWADLLALESRGSTRPPDPARRAVLALLARAHGRGGDAWRHFESLAGAPGWAARVMPALLPGVPPDASIERGGRPAPLAAGTTLRPLLPPATGTAPAGTMEWREAELTGLRIGGATVDFKISVEGTGVQVDLTHRTGDAVSVPVLLPDPDDLFEIGIEYLDWMRQDTLRVPLTAELKPGEERTSLYGRFRPRGVERPTLVPGSLPAQVKRDGLLFVIDDADPDRPRVEALAAALANLLGVAARTGTQDEAIRWPGTSVHCGPPDAPDRERVLRYVASSVESFVLGTEAR